MARHFQVLHFQSNRCDGTGGREESRKSERIEKRKNKMTGETERRKTKERAQVEAFDFT